MQNRLVRIVLLVLVAAAPTLAVTYTSVTDGNWSSTTTWSPAGDPGPNDSVVIGHRVVFDATDSIIDVTIDSTGKLVCIGANSMFVYGNWTKNGGDSLTNGFVWMVGTSNATIGGSQSCSFVRLYIAKDSLARTVTLNQATTVSGAAAGVLSINVGTLATNGSNLTVNANGSTVAGTNAGKLAIFGGGTVTLRQINQGNSASGLGLVSIADSATTVNIIYRHDIGGWQSNPPAHRCDISGGTVNYLYQSTTSPSLYLIVNNEAGTSGGWYATGGTISFSGSISGSMVTRFKASGSAVVRFVGSDSASVVLGNAYGGWQMGVWDFNDLRIEKTGNAVVMFTSAGTMLIDSNTTASVGLTVASGARATLGTTTFRPNFGYVFNNVINNGTITYGPSNAAFFRVSGSWTGAGTFNHSGKAVTFVGAGTDTLGPAASSFYDVIVNKPAGTLAVTGHPTIEHQLSLQAGVLAPASCTLSLGSSAASCTVLMSSGTAFKAAGGSAPAVITATNPVYPYNLNIPSGCTISGNAARFVDMDGTGILVTSGATVDPAVKFSDCWFERTTGTGPMLKVENNQTLDTLYNISFSGPAGSNIEKQVNAGHVTVAGGGGNRWGASFEFDPNSLIVWVTGDVGVSRVIMPRGEVDESLPVSPEVMVYNYGSAGLGFSVRVVVDSAGTPVFDATQSGIYLSPGDSVQVAFSSAWTPGYIGDYSVTAFTTLAGDLNPANDTAYATGTIVQTDIGITAILAPADTVGLTTSVAPSLRLQNYGTSTRPFGLRLVIYNGLGSAVYDETETGITVAPGNTADHAFTRRWTASPVGDYTTLVYTVPGDRNPLNDTARNSFSVASLLASGWYTRRPVPDLPSGKPVKDGGWLAYNAGNELIYAAKGNKTSDFFAYDADRDSWKIMASWPDGIEAKKPSKGAIGTSDGAGTVYATKGNNTQGFWKYDATLDSWYQKKDVPLGLTNKKVKGGNDLAHYNGFVYLLKGNKNEFLKYDVANDSWTILAPAPLGASGKDKYDKGSWLVYNGDTTAPKLYAHKAKYHELFAYDLIRDTWQETPLSGMPFTGMMGKSKKSKDGGSATLLSGYIYALKGGNTQEFWRYDQLKDSWKEQDTMPLVGTNLKKKKVKAGADIAATSTDFLYALKGNKTQEFWAYLPGGLRLTANGSQPAGVMARLSTVSDLRFAVWPNPLRAGFATVMLGTRSELSGNSVMSLRIYDATGRMVLHSSLGIRNSSFPLDLRSIPTGVYVVKLSADGFTATQKLVVER